MKKYGFTLVELLAVIAILAILVIIALPNVMGMFNSAKKESFTTELKEIYKTAQQAWMSDSMFSTDEKVYSRCKTCTGKSLDLNGRSELEYYIKIDKSGKVVEYHATDGTYQFSYTGDLLATNIKGVESVSDLSEDEKIKISGNSVLIGKSIADKLIDYYNEGNECIVKYTGDVTDSYNNTKTATKVYYDNCQNYRNVIFGGSCWEIVRTTENGGIKMVYTGEPSNGNCSLSRTKHKGLKGSAGTTISLNSNYLYGSSFTYDLSTSTFTLLNTSNSLWNDNTYQNIIGKYTCLSNSSTCSTLYSINSYNDSTSAYVTSFVITDVEETEIGQGPFNANNDSPAMVGYMFGTVYNTIKKTPGTDSYKFSSDVTYDSTTNTYTLSGSTKSGSRWSYGLYQQLKNYHYTCWNTTGTCNKVSFIFLTQSSEAFTLVFENGNTIETELSKMTEENKYNSTIKGILDAWYVKNLSHLSSKLENAVYCNNRSILDLGGLSKTGNNYRTSGVSVWLYYTKDKVKDLSCNKVTDQFTLNNNAAKLTYPIGLLTNSELNGYSRSITYSDYWTLTPAYFNSISTQWNILSDKTAMLTTFDLNKNSGIRPTITLNAGNRISSGSGSYSDPWIIE